MTLTSDRSLLTANGFDLEGTARKRSLAGCPVAFRPGDRRQDALRSLVECAVGHVEGFGFFGFAPCLGEAAVFESHPGCHQQLLGGELTLGFRLRRPRKRSDGAVVEL